MDRGNAGDRGVWECIGKRECCSGEYDRVSGRSGAYWVHCHQATASSTGGAGSVAVQLGAMGAGMVGALAALI